MQGVRLGTGSEVCYREFCVVQGMRFGTESVVCYVAGNEV